MKEFIVKENQGFRLRVKSWKCHRPADLNALEFIQESIKDGEVDMTSTYQFFLTDAEVSVLAKSLVE